MYRFSVRTIPSAIPYMPAIPVVVYSMGRVTHKKERKGCSYFMDETVDV